MTKIFCDKTDCLYRAVGTIICSAETIKFERSCCNCYNPRISGQDLMKTFEPLCRKIKGKYRCDRTRTFR